MTVPAFPAVLLTGSVKICMFHCIMYVSLYKVKKWQTDHHIMNFPEN